MSDRFTPDARFEGFGVTADGAEAAAQALAGRINDWLRAHPGRRILQSSVQSAALGNALHMTALIAYSDDLGPSVIVQEAEAVTAADTPVAVALAEEIVAEVQQDAPERD